ncbi:uncharacterized protein A4U43_C06F17480 [Asparagus officinalis]|uniref:Ubiquitin-like protease family profile domain-containing protein n=1 Tax=Asparagus officinalis TaxID=4686 RepID=A0A5P1ERK0_ASPOF|nr:uncharacterized protein A4U43_C06F17480 [Asparagus officinalis]
MSGKMVGIVGKLVVIVEWLTIPDSFEDVIYPKGDPDAVAISKRDIELLQPDTFINDTIIDFYVKYLKTRIPHNERHRFHFFNSFFFRKLADLDKDPGSASEGRAAFLRVRKWTRKVNIFEKDYIFIPVNFNLHWSLLVVCHPGEVSILEEEDIKDSPKVPCILHMDSIKGSHSGLKNLVQSYLMEEWKERHPDSVDDHTSKFSNMRFVSLELPQQENSFDCGLFLLHYVELFLEEAPINFNPFKINKFNSFLTMDWFIPSEASFKRSLIRKLIYDLLNDPSQNVPPTSNDVISSGYHDSNTEQRPGLEFLNKHYDTSKTYVGNSTCSLTVSGIEMNLETLPSPGVAQCDKQGRRVMHEFLEPRTSSMSLFQEDASFQMPKCATSSNKEHADKSKQFSTSNLDRETHCPVGENSTSYCLKDVGEPETPWNSMQEQEEIGLSLLPKSCNVTVSNLSGEIQERTVSVEDCGCVSDSPPSSSGENQDGGTDCSQEIDTSKTVGDETYEISQEIETATETERDDIKHEEVNMAEAKDYGEDGEKNDSHETDTNKAEALVSEEFQSVVDTTNVVDCVKDEDIQRNDNHNDEESFPPQNSKNVAVADEISLARDGRQLKRGGPSSRIEKFYQKRRKVLRPDGERRCTRSLSRDSTTS